MKQLIVPMLCSLIFSPSAFAARPLSTDDAGTVEKAHVEIEGGFEYVDDTDDEYNWSTSVKYGLLENWDIGIEIPYQYLDVAEDDDVDGLADIVVCSKYLFVEEDVNIPALAFSFSVKTKTGDDDKGLGSGAVDYALNMILSKELGKVITHLNFGYTYQGAPQGQSHDDIFSYAWALEYPLNDRLNLLLELTGESNFEGDFDDNPFAGLAGLNLALSDTITFDLGVGWKISEASPDYLITTGLTLSY